MSPEKRMRLATLMLALVFGGFGASGFADHCPAGGVAGDLYVATSSDVVSEHDGGGFVCDFVLAGSGGFAGSNGVTWGPNGNLFVASSGTNHAVLEYDGDDGHFIQEFAISSAECPLANPVDLAFGPNGNLFVVSNMLPSVVEYDGMTGACVATHCVGIEHAIGLAFDAAGDLFVSSQLANIVKKIDLDSGSCTEFCSGLNSPHDVLFRDNGNLLVANRGGDEIVQCDPDGTNLGVFANMCGLMEPYGMTFGPNGDLFVASVGTGKIIRFLADGGCSGIFADVSGSPKFLEFKPFCDPPCVNGTCTGSDTCTCGPGWTGPTCEQPVCGDGIIVGSEECDDGNPNDGEGCSSTCTVEPGAKCTGEPSVCITGIPAISDWGLVVMSLLVLTAGTLVYARRRPIHV